MHPSSSPVFRPAPHRQAHGDAASFAARLGLRCCALAVATLVLIACGGGDLDRPTSLDRLQKEAEAALQPSA